MNKVTSTPLFSIEFLSDFYHPRAKFGKEFELGRMLS